MRSISPDQTASSAPDPRSPGDIDCAAEALRGGSAAHPHGWARPNHIQNKRTLPRAGARWREQCASKVCRGRAVLPDAGRATRLFWRGQRSSTPAPHRDIPTPRYTCPPSGESASAPVRECPHPPGRHSVHCHRPGLATATPCKAFPRRRQVECTVNASASAPATPPEDRHGPAHRRAHFASTRASIRATLCVSPLVSESPASRYSQQGIVGRTPLPLVGLHQDGVLRTAAPTRSSTARHCVPQSEIVLSARSAATAAPPAEELGYVSATRPAFEPSYQRFWPWPKEKDYRRPRPGAIVATRCASWTKPTTN